MITSTGLSIGNVYISINSEYPIRILPHVEKTHSDFRGVVPPSDAIIFKVSVMPEESNGLSGRGNLIGETSSWKVYQAGDGRELIWPGVNGNDYLWRLVIDKEIKSATVYVGEDWIEESNGVCIIKDIVNYPLDELLFMYAASGRDGLLIHSAGCVVYDNIGFIFCGKSGAGKSTISKQLIKDDDISLLSDDRIIIHRKDNEYFMSGTPWPGEAGIAENRTVPLRALFFLKQSLENRLEKITENSAFKQILPVASILWHEKDLLSEVLDFCEDVTRNIPAFNIYFSSESGVTELIKEFVG